MKFGYDIWIGNNLKNFKFFFIRMLLVKFLGILFLGCIYFKLEKI